MSGACASGSHAIGLGYLLIKQGLQDCIICGGAEEVNVFSVGNFDALSAFSIREDEPTKASRPFDKNRDGLVPSGGAACVIIESYGIGNQERSNHISRDNRLWILFKR